MFSYFFVLAAVFTRILPHPWLSFTAVGASLLVFGARRSPKLFILPVLALAAADYYLTVFAYNYSVSLAGLSGHVGLVFGCLLDGLCVPPQAGECGSRRRCSACLFYFVFPGKQLRRLGWLSASIRTPRAALRPAISQDFRSIATMFWQPPC